MSPAGTHLEDRDIGDGSVAGSARGSQVSEKIGSSEVERVQPSQLSTGASKNFTTRLTPNFGIAFAPGTAPGVATTPTTADLTALHGGRSRLLRVAEVANRLGGCAATVYRLCESGTLPHVRIVNSIRVRLDAESEAGLAGSRGVAVPTLTVELSPQVDLSAGSPRPSSPWTKSPVAENGRGGAVCCVAARLNTASIRRFAAPCIRPRRARFGSVRLYPRAASPLER